ncbi:MAG: [FeFe] hydrogenase, group A [Bacteroidales bacterium]|nr:[FeFe] hydrogenase, group A [Bacteroidales bacterium]
MKGRTTRRQFIKTTALGAGFLTCYGNLLYGQAERQRRQRNSLPFSPNNPAVVHNMDNCRNCGRCRDLCRNVSVFEQFVPADREYCINCGQCSIYCPNVITERFSYPDVAKAIADPNKIVVATTAPAIRVAVGEMYGLEPGTNVESKLVGALNQLGVDYVLDATFAADLTIMEEASELLERLGSKKHAKHMPMFTSCCPGWVRYVKLYYPELIPNLSTAKSPMMMQGALVKTYFAEKNNIDPEKIVHVALMPCTAKKGEILLPGMNSAGVSHRKPAMRDVDHAITSREIAYLLNEGNVNFLQAPNAQYSSLMGRGSGAGVIFGNTGGVMEAALRTAYKVINGQNPPADFLSFAPVRGFDSVKQATVDLGKAKLNIAVVSGIVNMKSFIETLKSDPSKFDFVEVMACAGGCIGGGGQPVTAMDAAELKKLRQSALYQQDAGQELRLSCDNPEIKTIYNEFLKKPLGKKSEEFLHVRHT